MSTIIFVTFTVCDNIKKDVDQILDSQNRVELEYKTLINRQEDTIKVLNDLLNKERVCRQDMQLELNGYITKKEKP